MISDTLTTFCTALAASSSGNNRSDYYDCGLRNNYDDGWNSHPGQQNVGKGERVRVLITITEAFAGTGTTCDFRLEDSADHSSWATIVSSGAIAKATLVAGYQFELTIPDSSRRYLDVNAYTDNTFETTGKFTAEIVPDVQTNGTW